MRIRTLVLKNFRSHQETVLELDRFNFIRGPNGCGKSSIQMALEYLLTGRCQLTDAAGRGAEALIRAGEKKLEVSVTLENGDTICRRRTARSQIVEVNGKRVPVDAAEAFLAKRFGSADVLSAVLNADRFVEMSEAEQQRLLAQLVEAGKVDIPAAICDALRAINEKPPRLASVGDVEAAHKRFYDLRTEAHRALKAMGHMEKPDVPSDLPSLQEVRKKLEELRQQKEGLVAQKAMTDAAWENAQARLKQLQAEIEEVSLEILSPSQEQESLQLESQQSRAEKLRQELADLIAQQKAVETSLAAIGELKGSCPTCGQTISEEMKAKQMEALRERRADLEGLIQGTKEELSEYAEMEAARSRLEGHRRAFARRAKLIEEQSKLQGVQKPNAGDLESRMTILAERISKGERVLEKVLQIENAKDRWEASVREKFGLEKKIGLLDRLTEFFGPNGAMMGQAQDRMGAFTEDLNRHLAVFGYTCNLALDPFEIRVSGSKDNHFSLPLKHLSESEQFRFGVAFQISLAMVTGLRFVVIDRADLLDKEKRKMLTSLLLNSKLDQAIVLATSEDAPPSIVPQGVKFLSLVEGLSPEEGRASIAACRQRGAPVRFDEGHLSERAVATTWRIAPVTSSG
jgi:DNA repair exonuclease SbcCD ATPase subunit